MTLEDLENIEVISWRELRLVSMGLGWERAYEIARTTVDLYELERLLERGCPAQTAVSILR